MTVPGPLYNDPRRTRLDVRAGDMISAARLERGVSQVQLAEDLTTLTGTHWTQVKVSNLETSRRLPTLSQLYQVAHALGVAPHRVIPRPNPGEFLQPQRHMPLTGYPSERAEADRA